MRMDVQIDPHLSGAENLNLLLTRNSLTVRPIDTLNFSEPVALNPAQPGKTGAVLTLNVDGCTTQHPIIYGRSDLTAVSSEPIDLIVDEMSVAGIVTALNASNGFNLAADQLSVAGGLPPGTVNQSVTLQAAPVSWLYVGQLQLVVTVSNVNP